MAEFVIDLKDPTDTLRVQADYWQLDGYDWFDFYRFSPGDEDDILTVTVRAADVRSIRRFEEPTPA